MEKDEELKLKLLVKNFTELSMAGKEKFGFDVVFGVLQLADGSYMAQGDLPRGAVLNMICGILLLQTPLQREAFILDLRIFLSKAKDMGLPPESRPPKDQMN